MRRSGLVALAAIACVLPTCSDGNESDDSTAVGESVAADQAPLRVDLIAEAMAAVDQALGAPQQYFEVNATPRLVNLFVATDNATTATAYVYLPDSGLQDPVAPEGASGPTFTAADVAFAPTVLDTVLADLPTSTPTLFAVNEGGAGSVEYRAYFSSPQGGEVVAVLGADGAVLATEIS